MYNISEIYKEHIINSITRKPKSKIIVGDIEYTGVAHLKTFPKIEHTTVDIFGSFPAKTCEFEIYNIGGNVDFRGKEVSVYRGLDIEGSTHWTPMGIFKAESKDITSNLTTKTIKFKGSDRSHLFDVAFNSALHTYPCRLLTFVKQLCTNHGIVLENEDFPFYDYELEKAPEFAEGITEREIIRKIAQLGGCIAQITRDGNLKISQPEVADIPVTSGKYSSLSRENTTYVTGLTLSQSGSEDITVNDNTYVGAYGEFVYKIKDNPFIKDRRNEVIDRMASCYLGRNITPFVIGGFIDDFIYDLNDLITVKDKSGAEFTSPLLSLTTQSRIKSDFKTEVPKENNSSDGELEGSLRQDINETKKNVNSYKNAQSALNELMSNALGLYISEADDGNGGKFYYYHDTSDIVNATYIATINSNGFAFVSGSGCWNGGNPTWIYGIDKEGNAILKMLNVYKLTADLIEAGILTSTDGSAKFDLDKGEIILNKTSGTEENEYGVSVENKPVGVHLNSNGCVIKTFFDGNMEELYKEAELTEAEEAFLEDKYGSNPLTLAIVKIAVQALKVAAMRKGLSVQYSGEDKDYETFISGKRISITEIEKGTSILTGIRKKIDIFVDRIEPSERFTVNKFSYTPRVLVKDTDFDEVLDVGPYVGEHTLGDGSVSNYLNSPSVANASFNLEVLPAGTVGQLIQRLTMCSKAYSRKWERHYYANAWGEWFCTYEDTGWLDCTMLNGCTYGTELPYLKARYKNGVVYIQGQVLGIANNWQSFATLPPPIKNVITQAFRTTALYNMSNFCGIVILTNGNMAVSTNSSGTWAGEMGLNVNINFIPEV